MKERADPQTATGGESTLQRPRSESLGIRAVAALPMGLLAWVIGPTIILTSCFIPVAPEGSIVFALKSNGVRE